MLWACQAYGDRKLLALGLLFPLSLKPERFEVM